MRQILFVLLLLVVACEKNPTQIIDHQPMDLPTPKSASLYHDYLLGEMASNKNNFERSIGYFEKVNQVDDDLSIDFRIAVEYARNFQFKPCLDIIDSILEKKPNDFDAKLLRAKVYATQGNYVDSQKDFEDILNHSELSERPVEKERIRLSLVALLIEAQQFDDAKVYLDQMRAQDPEDELAYYYLARISVEQGELEQAQNYFEKTIEINPNFLLAYRALILLYEYNDNQEKKVQTLETILKYQPTDIQIRTSLIQYYLENKNFEAAKVHEDYFGNRFEQNVYFCYELGLFYVQNRMFVSANQVFTDCEVLYPDDNQIKYYHALSLFYVKNQKESLDMFSSITPESEFFEKSILARASILRELQTHEEIVKVFDEGIRQKPESSEIPLHFARYQFEKKNYADAQSILKRAIRKFEQQESLKLLLAEVHERQQQYPEMERVLRSILEANPSSASALNFLGYSYADRGIRLQEAEQLILKALEIRPQDGYIQDSLAWVYYKQSKYEKARKVMEVVVQNVSDESVIWEHYGDILVKVGDIPLAIKAYTQALEWESDDDKRKRIEQKIQDLSSR